MDYQQFDLEQLNRLTFEYLKKYGGNTCEFDFSINDISRALVARYHEKHGKCFLGKINHYESFPPGEKAPLVPYAGQLILNFEYAFVVPCMDERLIELITEHNSAHPVFDNRETYKRCCGITERIGELGGHYLFWA